VPKRASSCFNTLSRLRISPARLVIWIGLVMVAVLR
jgi:hypothetical protein